MKLLAPVLFATLLFVGMVDSAEAVKLKIGVLAPDGTSWAKNFKKMSTEIKKETGGAVNIKFYFGGSQGDEPDVLRKIHVGQLHGGIFTGKTLGEINGDVRVMELPFTFIADRKKAFATLGKMEPFFNKGFEKKKFKNLGFFELGLVYFVSTKKAASLETLNGIKIWAWSGDELVGEMVNSMKLVSVPLALTDVLSSLSTGIVEAAYGPPMAMMAMQWNTKVKYLVDFPLAYSVGAFLVGHKGWNKVSAAHKAIVEKIAAKYVAELNGAINQENIDAMTLMKSKVEFIQFPKKDLEYGSKLRKQVIGKLTGKLFSKEALDLFEKNLK